jgi:SAM-dependent methyltransferase
VLKVNKDLKMLIVVVLKISVSIMLRSREVDFVKPPTTIIQKSKGRTECGCWKPYTSKIVGSLYWKRYREVFDYLKLRRWSIVLEIGCGYGFFLPSLCQIADKVIASDIKEMFDFVKKTTLKDIQRTHSNLHLKKADVRNLSRWISEECDVIVAISVLEHVDNLDSALNEIRKCLKPKGLFACVLPSENRLYKLGRKILGYSGDYHKNYEYEFVRSGLCRQFDEIKVWSSPFNIPLYHIGIYQRCED